MALCRKSRTAWKSGCGRLELQSSVCLCRALAWGLILWVPPVALLSCVSPFPWAQARDTLLFWVTLGEPRAQHLCSCVFLREAFAAGAGEFRRGRALGLRACNPSSWPQRQEDCTVEVSLCYENVNKRAGLRGLQAHHLVRDRQAVPSFNALCFLCRRVCGTRVEH